MINKSRATVESSASLGNVQEDLYETQNFRREGTNSKTKLQDDTKLIKTKTYEVVSKVSDVTKIQDIFSEILFIFQLSLLVTLHTSLSDAPISVTRPNSTWRFSLQNNCSRR